MKTLGLKPTLATCVGFLQLAQKMKDERLLMEVHKIMETIPNWTATVYLEVMMGYQKFNKWLACQHLYQKMIEKTIPLTTYTFFIETSCFTLNLLSLFYIDYITEQYFYQVKD